MAIKRSYLRLSISFFTNDVFFSTKEMFLRNKGMPCVYHLLREDMKYEKGVARLLIFRFFYNKKKFFLRLV